MFHIWFSHMASCQVLAFKIKLRNVTRYTCHLMVPASISYWNRNLPRCWVWWSAAPGCPVACSWKTPGWQTSRWTPSSPPYFHSRSSCELRGGEEGGEGIKQNTNVRCQVNNWRGNPDETRRGSGLHSLGPVKEMQRSVIGSSFDVSMPFPPSSCTKSPDSAQPGRDLCGKQNGYEVHKTS